MARCDFVLVSIDIEKAVVMFGSIWIYNAICLFRRADCNVLAIDDIEMLVYNLYQSSWLNYCIRNKRRLKLTNTKTSEMLL